MCFLSTSLQSQGLVVGDQEVWVHGINIPWRYYGEDFGSRGRRQYDPEYYDRLFERVSQSGLNAVRMWIHCDGRSTPQRSSENAIHPLSDRFLDDIESFVDQAATYDLLVMPVLWTFEMADGRLHQLLTDTDIRTSYLEEALRPLVIRLKDKCNILAWEVINEPEWAMDIPFAGTTRRTVPAEEMQRFVADIANEIHSQTKHRVTVGSAGLRFSTDAFPLTKNYWHDLSFQRAGVECKNSVLDFYSVHYYRWKFESLSPFRHAASDLDLDKPVLISEFGLLEEPTINLLDKALFNGYAGTMPWSMMANDKEGSWEDYESQLQLFAVGKKALLEASDLCMTTDSEVTGSCLIYPNPAHGEVNFSGEEPSKRRVLLYNGLGQLAMRKEVGVGDALTLNVQWIAGGTYLTIVQVQNADKWTTLSRQLLFVRH